MAYHEQEWRLAASRPHLAVTRDARVMNTRIRNLYQPRHPRYGARPLARELGVHHTTVFRAVTGEGWAHIPSQEESRGRTAA